MAEKMVCILNQATPESTRQYFVIVQEQDFGICVEQTSGACTDVQIVRDLCTTFGQAVEYAVAMAERHVSPQQVFDFSRNVS